LPHLFTEFYRAPNARRFGVGTGLGLAIVQDLVQRYGGQVRVQSAEGQGTTFTITLPLWRADVAGAHSPKRKAHNDTGKPG
jgi:signal transduction histidine kinase